jgi:hypothetical protein
MGDFVLFAAPERGYALGRNKDSVGRCDRVIIGELGSKDSSACGTVVKRRRDSGRNGIGVGDLFRDAFLARYYCTPPHC